ncbi:MAG: enoyl-CoA hydratase/isomerase family protein [Solirubrobacterales bacterium]|nr:enoyl-CoA hydratase/isomerase family protein [Solirubrobacterales bacterium]
MPAPYVDVRVEQEGGVARLILDAPARRNALTVEMARSMVRACDDLDADPGIGAVVVCGEGAYFCAGGDRAALAAAGQDPAHPDQFDGMGDIYHAFARVGQLKAPTIAAIRGGAVGAGMNLAMATDLRIVARDAVLASGFIPIGLHPGGGHGVLLGRTGAREATAALMLFGERIDGERAAELGLAWAAVDAGDVEATALELAARPGNDPVLARRTAASLRTELGPPALAWNAALELERAAQMWSMRRKSLLSG